MIRTLQIIHSGYVHMYHTNRCLLRIFSINFAFGKNRCTKTSDFRSCRLISEVNGAAKCRQRSMAGRSRSTTWKIMATKFTTWDVSWNTVVDSETRGFFCSRLMLKVSCTSIHNINVYKSMPCDTCNKTRHTMEIWKILPSLKLTLRTRKWVVGIRSFPFGMANFHGRKC